MVYMLGDIDIGWRTVRQEAANQGFEGMVAVAWTLRNRLEYRTRDRWNTLAQVCLDWLQFSGWRESDPTFAPSLVADLDAIGMQCLHALTSALSGATPDPTQGARHYFNPNLVSPKWARGKVPCYRWRDHVFFNDID